MPSVRVASLQYYIRPVQQFSQYRDQVQGLVETAADYRCQIVVFPEYFTLQLLTLGDLRRPMAEQVHDLANQESRLLELWSELARDNEIYIVAGTTPILDRKTGHLHNVSHVVSPTGEIGRQPKIHMTRFEREEWDIFGKRELNTFETDFGRIGVAICYDVEFPDIPREHARNGAQLLIVPSCTDERQGFLRVRYCAHARAIENHMYVVQSSTVGSLPMVPAVSLNYGQASILSPSDFAFSRDGIAAEGIPNQESIVIADVNLGALAESHSLGTVLPLIDAERQRTKPLTAGVTSLVSDHSGRVLVRSTSPADFEGIIELCRKVYPNTPPWTREQLLSHLAHFPEGQIVAFDPETQTIVGMAASLIVDWDDYDMTDNWRDFTDRGFFTNHDPTYGRTLYGAEVMVDPEWRGQGVGGQLYDVRNQIAKRLRLLRIRAGARLRGYSKHADRMSPQAYTAAVSRGEIHDPTLSFQLKRGFRVLTVVSNYLTNDPESRGYAALIEWLNPEIALPKDYAAQPERYRAEPQPEHSAPQDG
jgi:predicted amidohydrolase/GNAT superfamily N-acetyltransferase